MGFTQAIKKGISGVQSAYARQKAAAEARAKRRMETARTRLEKERIKLQLEREKLALQRELAEAKLAVRREKADLAKARAAIRGPSRLAGLSKSLSGGYKSLEKWYNRGSAPPRKRRTVAKRTARR